MSGQWAIITRITKEHDFTPEQFKQSARYEANVDRFEWLQGVVNDHLLDHHEAVQ